LFRFYKEQIKIFIDRMMTKKEIIDIAENMGKRDIKNSYSKDQIINMLSDNVIEELKQISFKLLEKIRQEYLIDPSTTNLSVEHVINYVEKYFSKEEIIQILNKLMPNITFSKNWTKNKLLSIIPAESEILLNLEKQAYKRATNELLKYLHDISNTFSSI